jgi:hypothetical protein
MDHPEVHHRFKGCATRRGVPDGAPKSKIKGRATRPVSIVVHAFEEKERNASRCVTLKCAEDRAGKFGNYIRR